MPMALGLGTPWPERLGFGVNFFPPGIFGCAPSLPLASGGGAARTAFFFLSKKGVLLGRSVPNPTAVGTSCWPRFFTDPAYPSPKTPLSRRARAALDKARRFGRASPILCARRSARGIGRGLARRSLHPLIIRGEPTMKPTKSKTPHPLEGLVWQAFAQNDHQDGTTIAYFLTGASVGGGGNKMLERPPRCETASRSR
jgi:hypothetical protein